MADASPNANSLIYGGFTNQYAVSWDQGEASGIDVLSVVNMQVTR